MKYLDRKKWIKVRLMLFKQHTACVCVCVDEMGGEDGGK